jgi:methionyl-tRNA formyltransferase
MRALFFGTPAIAVPALEALTEIADVLAVVCQPDRPRGRGLALAAPPVKERALALGIPVHQPTKVRTEELPAWIRSQAPDVAVVMAYGRILTRAVLDAPRLGCVNLHASILPLYRGAAPITWALVDGQTETGVSLMQMDEGMDTGPVLAVQRVPIDPSWNAEDLSSALATCAADVVRKELPRLARGELEPVAQDSTRATHARLLEKEDGRIPWGKPARAVHDHVRGMTPWPGAYTTLPDGRVLKVLRAHPEETAASGPAGTVVRANKHTLLVACGAGALAVAIAQVEGKKALTAAELVGGRTLAEGMVLGDGVRG